jgi:hypothetical protein
MRPACNPPPPADGGNGIIDFNHVSFVCHVPLVCPNDGHLRELSAKARQAMKEPARGYGG